MVLRAKICGLHDDAGLVAALDGGAELVGFVFFPPSPRNLSLEQAAELTARVPDGVLKVGLFVEPDDTTLRAVLERVPLDMIQLHGRESPARVTQIRALTGLPVIKAVPVATAEDLGRARAYEDHADWLLFDAKAPKGASRPGGNALAFDWSLLANRHWRLPWLLAGGLDAANLADAVTRSGARAVDVSSGVESGPGHKDPEKIKAFLDAARAL